MRKHRLMLDYDECSKEWVIADAEGLKRGHPELGDFVVNPSDRPRCWRLKFLKSELDWDTAIRIAEESGCDKKWLSYCKRYKCFAVSTVESKRLQPKKEVVNPPVREVGSPIKLVVVPASDFDARCLIRLCESIKDPEWVWKYYTPVFDLKIRVEIGCRDKPQAMRRLRWLSKRINGKFEVKSGD